MMTPELSRRVALALQVTNPPLETRRRVVEVTRSADKFSDLPAWLQRMIEKSEAKRLLGVQARSGLVLALKGGAEEKRATGHWDPHLHPRDEHGEFASVPGGGQSRFAVRADDARRAQGQTRSNFTHPVTGHALGKTETGDTYEALFEAHGAHLLEAKYGDKYRAIATTGGWLSRNTPLDFQVDGRGGELKSISSTTTNQKTAIKREEVERKQKAVAEAGLEPLLVVQVIDQQAGTVQVYGFEAFASKAVAKMEHLGEYRYGVEDFEAAQKKTGHHDKREARAAGVKSYSEPVQDGEIDSGDLVIELGEDGVPRVHTAE